jgi:carnitine-CoA ligase
MTAGGFVELLFAKAAREPKACFASFEGEPIAFAALARMAERVAVGLRRQGVGRGMRVAVMMRNSPASLALVFGLARAGIVWVPVNAQLRGPGLAYVLDHCEPSLAIVDAALLPTMRDCGSALHPAKIVGADDLGSWLVADTAFDEPLPAASDTLAICYTSGTTGSPKGVLVSHAMLRFAGEAVASLTAPRPGDTFLMWEPLYHIGGAQMLVLPLIREVRLAMIERFGAGRFWQAAREARASHIHFLGGVLQLLMKQAPGPLDRGHGVRIAWGGGCPSDLWQPFEERFGVRIREAYGMTEASSITTFNERGLVGAVGRPVPWFDVELRDKAGAPVAHGAAGEIVVRARRPEALFAGYFRDAAATARALHDGALWTGDLGRQDENGNFYFLGRLGDGARVRGENVSAWEVERVAAAHPDVEDCAMIAVDAEIGEQEIKLFVQPKPGRTIRPAELSCWLGERLAPYQNPRYIALVEGFERTPSQRIAKRDLPRDTSGCWDRLAGH